MRKKKLLCRKARYGRSLAKKPHFWPSQRLKQVLFTVQGCARLGTGPIITQIPRGYQKKNLFCRKARYVRSLAKKPHFWPSQSLKKVLFTVQGCARLRTGPIITQIPRGYEKKKSLLCRKSASLSIRWEFQFLDWWGGTLKKVLVLVQRPQHKSTPDPVAAPKNIPFGTIFIEFGDTKKCCSYSGLELAPKSRKKLIGALSCMHKGPK